MSAPARILAAPLTASSCVFDAGPLLAYLTAEPGGDLVRDMLADTSNHCFVHAVNIAEVFYQTMRAADRTAAELAVQTLENDGLTICNDLDTVFWQELAVLKAGGNISIADCLCVMLAQRLNAELITTDHKEFDPLVPLSLCPIWFIR